MGYRYIGSKARIADEIIEYVKETATMESGGFFVDAFSGTGVVAEKAAQIGWPVHVNDMMTNAVIMSEARLLSSVDVPFDCLGGYEEVIKVWPHFTSEHSLRTDNWHPVVKNAILEGLGARRGERVTPMGFINIADGGSYTNGR